MAITITQILQNIGYETSIEMELPSHEETKREIRYLKNNKADCTTYKLSSFNIATLE
jgi:hypothetical protein